VFPSAFFFRCGLSFPFVFLDFLRLVLRFAISPPPVGSLKIWQPPHEGSSTQTVVPFSTYTFQFLLTVQSFFPLSAGFCCFPGKDTRKPPQFWSRFLRFLDGVPTILWFCPPSSIRCVFHPILRFLLHHIFFFCRKLFLLSYIIRR